MTHTILEINSKNPAPLVFCQRWQNDRVKIGICQATIQEFSSIGLGAQCSGYEWHLSDTYSGIPFNRSAYVAILPFLRANIKTDASSTKPSVWWCFNRQDFDSSPTMLSQVVRKVFGTYFLASVPTIFQSTKLLEFPFLTRPERRREPTNQTVSYKMKHPFNHFLNPS